jgi:hypothetical protein
MIAKLIAAVLATVSLPLFADPGSDATKLADSTALTKYRCEAHDRVMALWFSEMKKNDCGGLRYGEVKVRCRINSDGTLSDLTVVVGESAGLLKTVSINVLESAAPFKPFGDDLIKEMGRSYMDEFDFNIVRKSAMKPTDLKQEYGTPVAAPGFD